jgi:Ca2+-transporting ATPase
VSAPGIAAPRAASPAGWHELDGGAVLARLQTDERGLSAAEARQRLLRYGTNELRPRERPHALAMLAGQFRSLIVWILIAAALISGALQEWIDCAVILSIVALNAVIGFLQERHAEQSLAALRRMTAPRARVRRDGAATMVPARDVVPGDVLELEAGDVVSGDARLLAAAELRTVEAALTGESLPVEKAATKLPRDTVLAERRNMLYLGTSIAAGSGAAVVVGTGADTELGRIASLIGQTGAEQTPLQQRLAAFGRLLVWACLGVVLLVFALGALRGEPLLDLFLTALSLAVAAVPEGLPAVVTIALAIGVQRMVRRRALVRRLHAVETLGSTSVICSDKTGTLTLGQMSVRELATGRARFRVAGEPYGPSGTIEAEPGCERDDAALRRLLVILVACNNARLVREGGAWTVLGDPTEGALLAAGAKAGVDAASLQREQAEVARLPFDSERKRMSVLCRRGAEVVALVKGAPDLLLARCTRALLGGDVVVLDEPRRLALRAQNEAMAARGLRVLAAAEGRCGSNLQLDAEQVERDLTFVGLVGMHDPPRPEAREAVARCRNAGIRVAMITGDQPATALAVARELGIAQRAEEVVAGAELDLLDDAQLAARAASATVWARVTAAHKLRIVRAHRAMGAVVAMTGDGVNDAPAIKGADIGIAMGKGGTEVTKEASDMVITDDNFATIVAAVEEGRGVYANIRKTLQYLLGGNCGELILMAAAVGIGLPVPLLAVHLLWINLVTDGLPALCLATDPIDPDVMRTPPRGRGERLADRAFLLQMLATGMLTASVSLAVYAITLGGEDVATARAHAFSALVFAELLRSFGCRSETKLVLELGLMTNLKLLLVVAASAALQLAAPQLPWLAAILKVPPMPMAHCFGLAAAGAIPLLVLESWKLVRRRHQVARTE